MVWKVVSAVNDSNPFNHVKKSGTLTSDPLSWDPSLAQYRCQLESRSGPKGEARMAYEEEDQRSVSEQLYHR